MAERASDEDSEWVTFYNKIFLVVEFLCVC